MKTKLFLKTFCLSLAFPVLALAQTPTPFYTATQTPMGFTPTNTPSASATSQPSATSTPSATNTVQATATPSVIATTATATPSTGGALSSLDQNYLIAIAQANIFEIVASQLAVQKATRADVSAFAQIKVNDHTAALAEVAALASQKGVTLPDAVNAAQAVFLEGLTGLSGLSFDAEFVHIQRVAHEEAIGLAATEAGQGSDPDVKANAASSLPTLLKHYHLAASLEGLVPTALTCLSSQSNLGQQISSIVSSCSAARKVAKKTCSRTK